MSFVLQRQSIPSIFACDNFARLSGNAAHRLAGMTTSSILTRVSLVTASKFALRTRGATSDDGDIKRRSHFALKPVAGVFASTILTFVEEFQLFSADSLSEFEDQQWRTEGGGRLDNRFLAVCWNLRRTSLRATVRQDVRVLRSTLRDARRLDRSVNVPGRRVRSVASRAQ